MQEQTLLNSLKSSGLRLTPQRIAICRALAGSEEHPTAQEIYDQLKPGFPSLSLATIYNTLEALVRNGAVNILGAVGDATVHYDADTSPHINLACLVCHKVIDFPSEHIQHVDLEVLDGSGYQLLGARVLYYGICPDCQKKAERQTEPQEK